MLDKAQKAFDYYENGEKLKAVKIFEQLIIEYPNSENYGRNLYNIPTIYQEIGDNELAIKWYLKILDDEKIKEQNEKNNQDLLREKDLKNLNEKSKDSTLTELNHLDTLHQQDKNLVAQNCKKTQSEISAEMSDPEQSGHPI